MANYKSLIAELADRLNNDVQPDLNNIVVLLIEKRVKIQIETDPMEEFLTVGAYVADLPPGKFREHILKDALKANYNIHKNAGILSYMGRENILTLHIKFALGSLEIDTLMDSLKHLTKRARAWQDAIEEGRSSPLEELPKGKTGGKKSIFGF